MVNNPAYLSKVLPNVTLSAGLFSSQSGMDSVTGPLAARVLGSGLKSMPTATPLTGPYNGPGTGTRELTNLITGLFASNAYIPADQDPPHTPPTSPPPFTYTPNHF